MPYFRKPEVEKMSDIVDIKVVIDKKFSDPKVEIYTKSETELVNNIIHAIENVSRYSYPPIPAYKDGTFTAISQRDIYRIRTEGREVILDTKDESYTLKGTLAKFENELDEERFFRSSQSEIINLYKVTSFDFNIAGTVGVLFDNGIRSYVARRSIKPLREKLKRIFKNGKED